MWHFKHKRIRHIKYFHCIIRVATFVYFYQVYYWKNLPLLLFSSRNVYLLLLVNEIFTLDNLSIIFFEKKAKVKNEDDTQYKKALIFVLGFVLSWFLYPGKPSKYLILQFYSCIYIIMISPQNMIYIP